MRHEREMENSEMLVGMCGRFGEGDENKIRSRNWIRNCLY